LQYPKNFSEIEELRAWKTRKKEEKEWIKIVTAVYEIPSSLLSKHCLHISSHIILAAFREGQTNAYFLLCSHKFDIHLHQKKGWWHTALHIWRLEQPGVAFSNYSRFKSSDIRR
jgi:hypothetical protein